MTDPFLAVDAVPVRSYSAALHRFATMRIVHLGHVPIPATHPDAGRISPHYGQWVLNHAAAQKRHTNMDVEVVTIVHKASCDFVAECDGVRVHFLRTFHPWRAATGFALDRWRVARYVRRLRPDVVHAHGTEDAYTLAAEWTGRPYVVTAQGLMFQILPRLEHAPHPMMRFVAWTERLSLRRARVAIAKSEYVREALAAEFPHLDLRVIPNTYQGEVDAPLPPKLPDTLVFLGTLDPRKGVHLIADALPAVQAAVPNVALWVIGNRPVSSGYEAEQLARLRATLGDRLVLHGRQPSRDIYGLLGQCVALLAPSLEEMFGNQLIEGLMCGAHGIVADETALAENVRRFGNGTIIPQRDSKALAQATIDVLRVPPSLQTQEATRERVRAYMGPASVAARHQALYAELMVGATPRIGAPA